MEPKPTLFNFLHDTLVQQIVSGRIAYGEKLPPLRALCDIYHVGIRTVRDVMDALVKEGYVEAVQRSHIKAAYRMTADDEQQAEMMLTRRDKVCAILKILAYIMPPIYAEASRYCDPQVLRACRDDIEGMNELNTKEQWRKSVVPLQRIKSVFHNDLLQGLCADFDLSAQIMLIPGFENPYKELSANGDQAFHCFFDCISSQDYDGIYAFISNMYHKSAKLSDQYFDEIASAFSLEKPQQEAYFWNAEKGRLKTHTQVTRSIIQKISMGVYGEGTYLPTCSQLCKEYNISAYTVGKVMESMEKIGLVRKMNLRGGYLVTRENAHTRQFVIKGSTSTSEAMTFLSAVHLLALISKGTAMIAVEYMEQETVEFLWEKVKKRNALEMSNSLLAALIGIQPYQPLKNVYEQLEKLVNWGCYYAFAYNDTADFNLLQEKSREAVQHLYGGDQVGFADTVQSMYYYIFHTIQKILLDFGVEEALRIKL